MPVYITGMSFGALSFEAKIALARGATMAGTATCSGEGGMIPDERRYSSKWFYQCIQSRYGFNPNHLRLADACEFFIGQGCKVGLGGHLMGQKVTDQVAEMRSLPAGIDQRSPARHPDWLGPDDLALKIQEIREATNGEIPIQLKLGAARVYDDVRMAAKTGPDSIYIDGMEGGTGAGPHIATEETGVPGIAAIRQARKALDDVGKTGEISLVYAGGIRNGGRCRQGAGARRRRGRHRPFGADGAQLQQGHPRGRFREARSASRPAIAITAIPAAARWAWRPRIRCCASGSIPMRRRSGSTTSCTASPSRRQMMARACGKTNVHSLEPEDLAALTMEASALAMVPLAGSQHTVGRPDMNSLLRERRAWRKSTKLSKYAKSRSQDEGQGDEAPAKAAKLQGEAGAKQRRQGHRSLHQDLGSRHRAREGDRPAHRLSLRRQSRARLQPAHALPQEVHGGHGLGRPELARGRASGLRGRPGRDLRPQRQRLGDGAQGR